MPGLPNYIKRFNLWSIRPFSASKNAKEEISKEDLFSPVSCYPGSKKGILFFPDWSYYNPYQKLLYGNLNKLFGCSVFGFKPEDFSIDCMKAYLSQSRILHLHWINVLYQLQDAQSRNDFISALLWAKGKGLKIVWTVHNYISHESENQQRELEIRKRVAQIADHLIVHGKPAREIVCESYNAEPEKVHIIPHGHYSGFYRNDLSRDAAREKLGIPDRDYVFLFFGNIRAYKGLESLVEAFVRINKKHRHTSLLIAGRGLDQEIRDYVDKKAHDCKKIKAHMKFVDDDDVQAYMNASDVVVLPYKNVLTSGAALLALSFMKPVLAPPKGLIPEVVDSSTGALFDDHKQMELMMEGCISGTNGSNWTESAFEKKLSRLDWDHLLKDSIFSSLLRS